MRRALDLAVRGPLTGGNPQVGCVLVDASGSIVAEGWHHGAGTPHAEIVALSQLPTHDGLPDARGLTAVVTLEPCNHTGRTGPCSEALIAAGVERVVYAVADPGPSRVTAPSVSPRRGSRSATGSSPTTARLCCTRGSRPCDAGGRGSTVKWASTLDGRAAAADGSSQWITGAAARQKVHEQRAASDAILVGTGTVLADDPSLTARGDAGELMPHQPLPVVVGERAIPADAKLHSHPRGVLETRTRDLDEVFAQLQERDIRRVYVEGGPTLASAVIAAGYADEFAIYLAPALLGRSDARGRRSRHRIDGCHPPTAASTVSSSSATTCTYMRFRYATLRGATQPTENGEN